MDAVMNASVIVPTLGRIPQLELCLRSLARCRPRAAEIVVVDQSDRGETVELVLRYADVGAHVVTSRGLGRGLGVNEGLRAAGNELVLITDDDCTVADSWVGVAAARLKAVPEGIVTGRVLPVGDPDAVPSTIDLPTARDYTGERHCRALYAGNMVASRSTVLGFGGFDERIVPSSEDNDFCYRWLRAGRVLRYEPDLVVWHHDWRTRDQLEQLYLTYARGQGVFYAKHLRRGDLHVLRYLARDLVAGIAGALEGAVRGTPLWPDARRRILRGLAWGLVTGWRQFGGRRESSA